MEYNEFKSDASTNNDLYAKKNFAIPRHIIQKESQNSLLQNLCITWAGYYEVAQGHFIRNRILNEHILVYCIDGKGWFEQGAYHWTIQAGDIFFCFKDMKHSYGADEKEPWSNYWVCFVGESAQSFYNLLQVSPQTPILHLEDKKKLISLFLEIFKTLEYGYSLNNLIYASSCVHQILSYMYYSQMYTYSSHFKDIDIEKIVNFMHENIDSVLTLKQLADYSNISKYYYSRKFKEKTGYSPIDYFNRLKIQKACHLLDADVMRISEVSRLIGLNSPYYFSALFKKFMGYSPKEYKKNRSSSGSN